jgi:hypothetical protein
MPSAMWPDRVPPRHHHLHLLRTGYRPGFAVVWRDHRGNSRLATVKVGKRFAALAPEGRAFATVAEGQAWANSRWRRYSRTRSFFRPRGPAGDRVHQEVRPVGCLIIWSYGPAQAETQPKWSQLRRRAAPRRGACCGTRRYGVHRTRRSASGRCRIHAGQQGGDTGSNAATPAAPTTSPMEELRQKLLRLRVQRRRRRGASGRPIRSLAILFIKNDSSRPTGGGHLLSQTSVCMMAFSSGD